MGNYRVFFPIVRTAKSQLAGDGGSRFVEKAKRQAPKWINVDGSERPIPTYKTQAAVTSAIAAGTFKGNSVMAYQTAKDYEKHLKLLEQWNKGFQPKQAKPRPNGSHNFTLNFSR